MIATETTHEIMVKVSDRELTCGDCLSPRPPQGKAAIAKRYEYLKTVDPNILQAVTLGYCLLALTGIVAIIVYLVRQRR